MSAHERLRYADSVEGVDVEKRYDETEFPFPSVVYDFESTRVEPVTITVEDRLPDAVEPENVGFHADYNGDDWAVDGNRLTFERELQPESGCRTIYAVSATATEDPSEIFVEPSVVEVSPPMTNGDGSDDVALGLSEPDSDDAVADGRGSDGDGGAPAAPDRDGDLLAALARELDSAGADPDDLDVLASAVADAMNGSSGSTDARLQRIESDVAELRAYSDAIADFLDENGGAATVLEEFDRRVETLEADLDAVRSRTDDLEADVDSVRGVSDDVDALSESLDDLATNVDDIRSSLGQTGDGVSLNDRVAQLEEQMTEMEEFLGSVRSAFE